MGVTLIQDFDWQQWLQLPRLSITITAAGYEHYTVRLETGADEQPRTGTAALTAPALRHYLADAFKQHYWAPDQTTLRQVGGDLYTTFLAGAVGEALVETHRAAYHRSVHALSSGPAPLQLSLTLQDPVLHWLPWEYLHDSAGELGSPPAPLIVVRSTPRPVAAGPLPFNWPLRLLVVVASPAIKAGLDVPWERAQLAETLGPALDAGQVALTPLDNPTREELAAVLARTRPHVLHYIGHGVLSRTSAYLALRFRDGRSSDFLGPADLGAMIPHGPLRLIGLQTPGSAPNCHLAAFAAFAGEIAAVGVGGICFSLRPESAAGFGELYRHVALGVPVDHAIQASAGDGPRLGFHQHAATTLILIDPHQSEVRLPPPFPVLEQTRSACQNLIEYVATSAASPSGAEAICSAGEKVIRRLEPAVHQVVLTPGQIWALRKAWDDFENVTLDTTGRALRDYAAGQAPVRAHVRPALAIPDNDHRGIKSSLRLTQAGIARAIRVHVDITHPCVGDLWVYLVAPSGRTAFLHDRQGGAQTNLVTSYDATSHPALAQLLGQQIQGIWALRVVDLGEAHKGIWAARVVDLGEAHTGTLNQWSLEVESSVAHAGLPDSLEATVTTRAFTRPPSETKLAERAEEHSDEIAFLQRSLSDLYTLRAPASAEAPTWLQQQIGDYETQLAQLISRVRGE